MPNYTFTDSPLMNELHTRWVQEQFSVEPSEVYERRNNFSKLLKDDLRFRMLNKKNFAIDMYSFYGRVK